MQTTCIIHEPAEQYHAQRDAYLSSHLLNDARKSLTLLKRKRDGLIPDQDRPAYVVGRALHTLALEGRDEYDARYAVGGPINEKTGKPYGATTKAFAEWASAQEKEILTDDQSDLVEKMAASVHGHEAAQELLSDGVAEGVVRANYAGTPCQIRMDWLNPSLNALIDLKTTDDLDYFESDARRYGYPWQIAFYRAVLAAGLVCSPADIACHFIAVEKKEPYRCGVWRVSGDVLAICQADNETVMDRVREAERTGVWPTGYEEPRAMEVI
jgi:hypothetical protein